MTSKLAWLALGLPILALATPAAAESCSTGPFSGPFLGASIGYGRADTSQTSPVDPKLNGDDSAFTGGVLAGYNLQCGSWIFGIETDFGHLGTETRTSWVGPIFLTDKIDWFGSTRGKLGVAIRNDTMVYVTGGVAYGDVSHRLHSPNSPGGNFLQDDNGWKTGWTIGGGIEFLRHERWLLRAEALYVDLGSETHTYTVTGCGGIVCTGTAKWDDTFWVARVGLSYKFGAHEEKHVPLK